MKKQQLELTWIRTIARHLEPRTLLVDPEMSYHAKHCVTDTTIFMLKK